MFRWPVPWRRRDDDFDPVPRRGVCPRLKELQPAAFLRQFFHPGLVCLVFHLILKCDLTSFGTFSVFLLNNFDIFLLLGGATPFASILHVDCLQIFLGWRLPWCTGHFSTDREFLMWPNVFQPKIFGWKIRTEFWIEAPELGRPDIEIQWSEGKVCIFIDFICIIKWVGKRKKAWAIMPKYKNWFSIDLSFKRV